MKKNILLALVAVFNIGAAFAQTYATIYTKGGKAVEVILRSEMDSSVMKQYDAEYRKEFPNATIIASSSARYNCHHYCPRKSFNILRNSL